MKTLIALLIGAAATSAQPEVVALPGKSPLIELRIAFRTGAVVDPAGKEGVAAFTAGMLAEGGTRRMTYKEILDALYPMAASVSDLTDKELTSFSGTTHVDNLDAFYKLLRSMLLEPGWRKEDF